MAVDIGSQLVSLIFFANATSANVNQRFLNIRPRGIYEGGRLAIVDDTHANLEVLVCEIGDDDHQVRIQTQAIVSVVVGQATPYVVLRWAYTGVQVNDYMGMTSVATPAANDLVVGKCTFNGGGTLLGFNYGDTSYPRSTPDDHQNFLKVVPTVDTELRVLVNAGYVQDTASSTFVPEQKSNLLTAPTANSKVYLIYVNPTTGVVSVDSSGIQAASPVAPAYSGKMVIAEINLATGATNIVASNIKDVRTFISKGPDAPDDVLVERNSQGELTLVDYSVGQTQLSRYAQFNTMPGWYIKLHSAGNKILPSEFNLGDPSGRMFSFGQLFGETSINAIISVLLTMQVFNASGTSKAVTQKLRRLDDNVFFYLNNTVTPFKSVTTTGFKSEDVIWNLNSGLNDLYIVYNNEGGPMELLLLGDIVNGTDVYFVGNV